MNTLHGIFQCARQQWTGQQEQRIYKYVQMYTQDQWKGGKSQFPKNGDLFTDDSTQLSTYIKTFTNKEKFQY